MRTPDPAAERAFLADIAPIARDLSTLEPARALGAVAAAYTWIALAWAATFAVDHPLVWIVAFAFVATRQHAVLVVLHDASHWRLTRDRWWNDALGNVLLAWPHLASLESFRAGHLAHHRYLLTERDPDVPMRRGQADWNYPMSPSRFARMIATQLAGGGMFRSIAVLRAYRDAGVTPVHWGWKVGRLAFYAAVLGVVWATGQWARLLLLWLLPMALLLPTIMRFRAAGEHGGMPATHLLDASRELHGSPFLLWMLMPNQVHLHLTHHLLPSVPFYRMPEACRRLQQHPYYQANAHVTRGLLAGGLLGELIGSPEGSRPYAPRLDDDARRTAHVRDAA